MFNFLNLHPEAFGLDISDLSLKAARLKKGRAGALGLVRFGDVAIRQGIVQAGEIKDVNALAQVIKEFVPALRGGKMDTKYAVCSLPEEKAFLQVIQLPRMGNQELKKAVSFEAENYIPLSLEKVYLDFEVVPSMGQLDHLDILLAALPKDFVEAYVECLRQAGFRPIAFEIEALAVGRALIKNGAATDPTLILDLGAARTGFTIFSGCSLRFTATIPVSSYGLSAAIARELKIDFEQAEKLKMQYGLSGKGGKEGVRVFEILVPQVTALVEEVKKYIDYYHTHTSHEHLSEPVGPMRILLCGGGANLKDLDSFLASELKLKTELGNAWANILNKPDTKLPDLSFAESLGYTTALGLALRGINVER